MLSGVINVVLNLILVIVFHLGVAGVAIATVAANFVSAGLIFSCLLREEEPFRLTLRDLRVQKDALVRILRIGLPAGVQSTVFPIANVCIQAGVNSFGSDAMAGNSIAMNLINGLFVVNSFARRRDFTASTWRGSLTLQTDFAYAGLGFPGGPDLLFSIFAPALFSWTRGLAFAIRVCSLSCSGRLSTLAVSAPHAGMGYYRAAVSVSGQVVCASLDQ
jgi:hypothetical protein